MVSSKGIEKEEFEYQVLKCSHNLNNVKMNLNVLGCLTHPLYFGPIPTAYFTPADEVCFKLFVEKCIR